MLLQRDPHDRNAPRHGYVLLAVLSVIVVLTLAAFQYSDLMQAESVAADRLRKATEAKAYADSGIHYAMAFLSDRDSFLNTLGSNPYDNPTFFEAITLTEGPSPRGTGMFSLYTPDYSADASTGGQLPMRFGVTDEASKININALFDLDSTGRLLHDTLMKLPGMTDEIAYSIVDWLDPDDLEQPGGAERPHYTGLEPPYSPKNGPLSTLEELLFVKGVTKDLLFGTDLNRNGRTDAGEDGANGFSPGWAAYLTVYSREKNVDNEGNARININGNDLATLQTDLIEAVGEDVATHILAYRLYGANPPQQSGKGQSITQTQANYMAIKLIVDKAIADQQQGRNRISSLFALYQGGIYVPYAGADQNGRPVNITFYKESFLADPGYAAEILPLMLDKLTTQNATDLPARINVNTAPREVLLALPSITEEDVDAILSVRPVFSGGESVSVDYDTPAWLITQASLPPQVVQAMDRYITARSSVFRLQSIGYFAEGGPIARVEAVIDTNNGLPRILYYRDLTEMSRSLDPRIVP
ncbi:MAG: type II secretion system protein GspK [Zavarzinella sp.]